MLKTLILEKIKAFHIFNFLAIGLLINSIIIFWYYENTEDKILDTNKLANKEYVVSIANNLTSEILKIVNNDIKKIISSNHTIQNNIKSNLRLFITTKYKHIYLITKNKQSSTDWKIIVDSSISLDEKAKILNSYKNLDSQNFINVYKNKKNLYIEHDKKVGATYLNPIILNDKVEAILVIEFSLQEQNKISDELIALENVFMFVSLFFLQVFTLIIWFSYMDLKREKQKQKAFNDLKELNHTLEYRIEEEIEKNRAQNVQMLHQSRLAQMGEMISMIAHQWRQPLAAISATSASINLKAQLGLLDDKSAIEHSEKISEYSQHLSSTIDDFRDFFKTNKKKKEISCNRIIESTLSIIEVAIKNNNIDLIVNLDCNKNINTYGNEMKQVILNLIKNAEDILIEKKIKNPYIIVTASNKTITVSDNAGGIPQDIIGKIFEPYFSTKISKNGTGLGLYMSKTIVEDHCGGKLEVENNDKGAIFTVVFP